MENQLSPEWPRLEPIGTIRTPFTEKFGVPKQAGMVKSAEGMIILNADPRFFDAVRGLREFSHVWVLFLFSKSADQAWKSLTTLPRTDVDQKVGVFASRSPYHPNFIGMSPLQLLGVDVSNPKKIRIRVSGVDLLDGTPILDIKPYIPFVDSIPEAKGSYTNLPQTRFTVTFSETAIRQIQEFKLDQNLIREMLELDPRPISQKREFPLDSENENDREFAFRLGNFDVRWTFRFSEILVMIILRI